MNAENAKEVVAPASDSQPPDLLLENWPWETLRPPAQPTWAEPFNEETTDILLLPDLQYNEAPLNEIDLFAETMESESVGQTPTVETGLNSITWQVEPELFAQFIGRQPNGWQTVKSDTETAPPQEATVAEEADDADEDAAEVDWDLRAAFDELFQEVRRVGREVFKANRAALRNQETFENALGSMEQMSSSLAWLLAHLSQASTPHQEAVFQAKAGVCRDLFGVLDILAASLQAAADVLLRLEENTQEALLRRKLDTQELLQHAVKAPTRAGRWPALWAWFSKAGKSPTALPEIPEAKDESGSLAPRPVQASWEVAVVAALEDSSTALRQWLEGQELLFERLQAVLETTGVRTIQAAGHPFDVAWHRAVGVELNDTMPDGYVVGEELTGYTLDGKVLRYAEVVVARRQAVSVQARFQ